VNTFKTGKISEERIRQLVESHFDLRPAEIIRYLDLRRPIFRKTAAYGHFGRNEPEFAWERTDRAEELRKAAGLAPIQKEPERPVFREEVPSQVGQRASLNGQDREEPLRIPTEFETGRKGDFVTS
jgi:hypothetical protein